MLIIIINNMLQEATQKLRLTRLTLNLNKSNAVFISEKGLLGNQREWVLMEISSVLHVVTSVSNGLHLWYGLMWVTKGGKRSLTYWGQRPSIILWNIKSVCRFLLSFNVQNPDSL